MAKVYRVKRICPVEVSTGCTNDWEVTSEGEGDWDWPEVTNHAMKDALTTILSYNNLDDGEITVE